jgi:hypothetical protein
MLIPEFRDDGQGKNKKNCLPVMEGEKVHLLMIKKVDAPRASPRRF